MRARHGLSKLLFRHGLVCDASAWTLTTTVGFAGSGSQSGPARDRVRRVATARMLDAKTRRDALDEAITELADRAAVC